MAHLLKTSALITLALITSLMLIFGGAQAGRRNAAASGYAELLNRMVTAESRTWIFNRYDSNSMRIVSVTDRTADSHERSWIVVRGAYTYNGGQSGWVDAAVVNGKVKCLEYFDRQGYCAMPPKPLSPEEIRRNDRINDESEARERARIHCQETATTVSNYNMCSNM